MECIEITLAPILYECTWMWQTHNTSEHYFPFYWQNSNRSYKDMVCLVTRLMSVVVFEVVLVPGAMKKK